MTPLPLDKETILKRLNGIQEELKELSSLRQIPLAEFKDGFGHKLAQFHMHRALEGVFHITGHLLSRLPGAQVTEYKAMARKLGECGIVDKTFAEETLVKMAGYRNRLVHFYAEITPPEIFDLLRHNLEDFDIFLQAVKRVLENPADFGFTDTPVV